MRSNSRPRSRAGTIRSALVHSLEQEARGGYASPHHLDPWARHGVICCPAGASRGPHRRSSDPRRKLCPGRDRRQDRLVTTPLPRADRALARGHHLHLHPRLLHRKARTAQQALGHDQDGDRDEDDEHDGRRARPSLDSTACFPKCHSCRHAQCCNDTSCQRCACNGLGVSCRQRSACKSCGSDTGVWCPQCLQDRCGLEWSEYLQTPSWESDYCRQRKSHGSTLLPEGRGWASTELPE